MRQSDNAIRTDWVPQLPYIPPNTIFEGYLCEDLSAASDTLTGPATAVATRLIKGASGNLEHGGEVTITNRDTTFTLEAWTYIVWTVINGENKIVWAACAGEVSSSCEGSS